MVLTPTFHRNILPPFQGTKNWYQADTDLQCYLWHNNSIPEDGESMFLWNMNFNLQHIMSKCRRPQSEKSLLWQPANLHVVDSTRSLNYLTNIKSHFLTYIITCSMANSPSHLNLTCQKLCVCSPEARRQMQCKCQCSILHFFTMYVLNTDRIPSVIVDSDRSILNMPVPNTTIHKYIYNVPISTLHSKWKRTSREGVLIEKH